MQVHGAILSPDLLFPREPVTCPATSTMEALCVVLRSREAARRWSSQALEPVLIAVARPVETLNPEGCGTP